MSWYPSDFDLDFKSGFLLPSDLKNARRMTPEQAYSLPLKQTKRYGDKNRPDMYVSSYDRLLNRQRGPNLGAFINRPVNIMEINQQDKLKQIIDQYAFDHSSKEDQQGPSCDPSQASGWLTGYSDTLGCIASKQTPADTVDDFTEKLIHDVKQDTDISDENYDDPAWYYHYFDKQELPTQTYAGMIFETPKERQRVNLPQRMSGYRSF